jgi:hypothetical protein
VEASCSGWKSAEASTGSPPGWAPIKVRAAAALAEKSTAAAASKHSSLPGEQMAAALAAQFASTLISLNARIETVGKLSTGGTTAFPRPPAWPAVPAQAPSPRDSGHASGNLHVAATTAPSTVLDHRVAPVAGFYRVMVCGQPVAGCGVGSRRTVRSGPPGRRGRRRVSAAEIRYAAFASKANDLQVTARLIVRCAKGLSRPCVRRALT